MIELIGEKIDWSSKKILIVEDDVFSTEYLREVISETNAQIIHCTNGKDAIELVKKSSDIDLILMDIQLPEMSGEIVTQKIRKIKPKIPIIAQTAHAMASDRENCLKAGCSDYLSKPILITDLFLTLKKYL
ncbi:MAG: response regulator [Bacteroidales bacterium]|nr:response regulator [Bacteroidales bacterium]